MNRGKTNGQRGKPGYLKNRKKDKTLPKTRKDANQDKRIENLDKKIKNMQNEIELKYFDVKAVTPVLSTGLLTLLNGMAQGTTQSTRISAQIKMTSVQWRFVLSNLQATLSPTVYRLLIVVDRQTNGADPTVAGSGTGGTTAILDNGIVDSLVDSPYQYESIKRFHILHDERGVINPQQDLTITAGTVTANQIQSRVLSGYVKLSKTVKYDASTSGVASINMNSLYSLMITNIATGITVTGGSRIYYRDN